MLFRGSRAAFAIMLVLGPITAVGQSGPAGYRERELAQVIREAGYDCARVDNIINAPISPLGWESMRPEIATCGNGKRFLVAKSGRSGGNVRPIVRPF